MKSILTSCFLLIASVVSAQQYIDTAACFYNVCFSPRVDTIYTLCDSIHFANAKLTIDSLPGNIWQQGRTTKFGAASVRDSSCAVMTDSLNSYPVNNYSTVTMMLNPPVYNYNVYFKFWHRFDTDSLHDGCWLELTMDSGLNWYPVNHPALIPNFFQNGMTTCNLYNNNLSQNTMDTLSNGQLGWSGNSLGWRYTALVLNFAMPIKPHRNGLINGVRFVFKSDSIQQNKAGWMIDDIEIGNVYTCGGLQDLTAYPSLPVYPNPSRDGRFFFSYPQQSVHSDITIYSLQGQKIISVPLQKEMNLDFLSSGVYYYKTEIDKVMYRGKLSVMR